MMELGQSTSIEHRLAGLFATEPFATHWRLLGSAPMLREPDCVTVKLPVTNKNQMATD